MDNPAIKEVRIDITWRTEFVEQTDCYYLEVLALEVQFFYSFVRKHVAGGLDCDDMRVLIENFEKHGTMVFSIGVLRKVQLDQRRSIHFLKSMPRILISER